MSSSLASMTLGDLPKDRAKTLVVRKLAPRADVHVRDALSAAHRLRQTGKPMPIVEARKERAVRFGWRARTAA